MGIVEDGLTEIPQHIGSGQRNVLLVVDKAFEKFLPAYPLPSKESHGVVYIFLHICLTLGVPSFIRADGGG